MNLRVERHKLRIESGNFWPDIDVAFVEEVLGLRNDGDSIHLVRKNASGLSCIAYLETMTEKQLQGELEWKERIKKPLDNRA